MKIPDIEKEFNNSKMNSPPIEELKRSPPSEPRIPIQPDTELARKFWEVLLSLRLREPEPAKISLRNKESSSEIHPSAKISNNHFEKKKINIYSLNSIYE